MIEWAFEKYASTQNDLSSRVHCMMATGTRRNTNLPSATISHAHSPPSLRPTVPPQPAVQKSKLPRSTLYFFNIVGLPGSHQAHGITETNVALQRHHLTPSVTHDISIRVLIRVSSQDSYMEIPPEGVRRWVEEVHIRT
ncbi:hypothetical protein J6590_063894 [Homalodisca vitripennis]|nr:hypothetical protein J6590_063894 [Homalodisca vitripennis]